jgi:aromatic ring hydroxylase
MRDGRRVYIGSERVDDVTRHPGFRHGAQTIADRDAPWTRFDAIADYFGRQD